MTKKIIVAIDGYSSCGKSTMAKSLAREIGYTYIDTGAMYRAVTLFAIQQNLIDASGLVNHAELVKALPQLHIEFKLNEQSLPELYLNGERVEDEIRQMYVANHVSTIAAIAEVRAALTAEQQRILELLYFLKQNSNYSLQQTLRYVLSADFLSYEARAMSKLALRTY